MLRPGGEVHHRIGPPADRPDQLFHLFLHRGGDGGGAHVGIDLHEEIAPDDHRLKFGVVDIGGDDGAAGRDLGADEFGGDVIGDLRAPILAVAGGGAGLAQLGLADRDKFHLGGDQARAGIGELRGGCILGAAQRLHPHREFRHQPVARDKAVILGLHMAALIVLDIAARHDPVAAQGGQALGDIGLNRGICVGAGTVIDRQGMFAGRGMGGDLAHRHADMGVQVAGDVDLARRGQGAGGHAGGGGLGGDVHVGTPRAKLDKETR